MAQSARVGDEGYPNEPIAIIGSGCRFPGGCNSPSKLWDLLREPRDVASTIPPSRFNAGGHYHADGLHHGTSNVRESYLLEEDVRLFDAQFFGVKGVEANSMDPQQRLLLETVYEGVERAGLKMEELRGSDTAVYVGLMCGDYSDMMTRDPDAFPTYFATGTARSILSNRVSYFFDWHGPSMTIDTACSSSLIALHQAVQTLRAGGSRVAVAAGANLILGPEPYIAESKLRMLSPTGRSRMWDADADGYARGDGVAAVVLKTLSAALADGDHIECIVRETGTNQDGRTRGITMPSATAQTALIRETYARAGLDIADPAQRPQYFEAHGTGTPTGDPLEAEAISTAFARGGGDDDDDDDDDDNDNGPWRLLVGSIKTVVGHTEGTAGLAGVLKASLALQHAEVPPNLLLQRLNPAVQRFCARLDVPTGAVRPWPALLRPGPRRASVNSFGFGGSNAHAILESWPSSATPTTTTPPPPPLSSPPASAAAPVPLLFAASSERALRETLLQHAALLDARPDLALRDVAWTLGCRRSHELPLRAAVSAASLAELPTRLRSAADDVAAVALRSAPASSSRRPRLLGVFTGQGAQWAGMGARLLHDSPRAAAVLDQLDAHLQSLPAADAPAWSLRETLVTAADLSDAALSQPLCTAVQLVLVDHARAAGLRFDAVVGHSSGEIAAAYAAGRLTQRDAIVVAYYRGLHARLANGPNGERGAMMAVGTSMQDAAELCELDELRGRIAVAACNSPASVTLSGDADAIAYAKDILDDEKKFARLLKVDKAYHSHHMLAASDAYVRSLQAAGVRARRPSDASDRPVWVSSVYAEPIESVQDDLSSSYWNNNMANPVLFAQALECALGEAGPFDLAVELGPHPALKGPASQVIQDVSGDDIPYAGLLSRGKDDVESFAAGLGYIWTRFGDAAVDFPAYDRYLFERAAHPIVLKDLPGYSWDHERQYWHESRISQAYRTRSEPFHELLGFRCADGTDGQVRWRNVLSPREIPWLKGHCLQGQVVFPGAGYVSAAVEAAVSLVEKGHLRMLEVTNLSIGQAAAFDSEESTIETMFCLTDVQRDPGKSFAANFSFYSSASADTTSMALNASGRISIAFGEPSEDTLPPRGPVGYNMTEVDPERFYESLDELGFEYSAEFKALSGLKRKLGSATGCIANAAAIDPKMPLLIHPAALDGAIQSIILAFCWPGDGRLWSLHVPVSIRSIRINPRLCAAAAGKPVSLQFDSFLASDATEDVLGDVDIYFPDEASCMLQVEGMRAVPLAGATAANDFQLFSNVVWGVASPDGEVAAKGDRASESDYEMASVMERIAYYYTRNLHKCIAEDGRSKWEWHHEHLYDWGKTMLKRVADGTNTLIPSLWNNDTREIISAEIARFGESVDLKVMQTIGENMPAVLRGETTIIEHLFKDNLLNDYYVNALGFHQYTNHLARMVAQVVHRHSHMDILEIGAGTGGATKSIFSEIGGRFSSYTFTDISSGFFEKAQGVFHEYQDKMAFKSLNAEQDVVDQGFMEGSYDLIIASLVIHATANLEKTLTNVRRLLKPGGYMILLEITNNDLMRLGFIFGCLSGWWLGVDDQRTISPCIATKDWDAVLRKTGFNGVDATTPDHDAFPYPLSVICAQAVDDRVHFLRDPLSRTLPGAAGGKLTFVGGTSPSTALLKNQISNLMGPREIVSRTLLEDFVNFSNESETAEGTVLVLADLDEPVFTCMNTRRIEGLKKMFERSKGVLWVTRGARADNPYANMMIGLARSVVLEMPHLRFQSLDLEVSGQAEADSRLISEILLRFELARELEDHGDSPLLWSSEPEIAVENGKQLVPRLKLNQGLNNQYNSARRVITKRVKLNDHSVQISGSHGSYKVELAPTRRPNPHPGLRKQVTIRLTHSLLHSFRVTSSSTLYLALGVEVDTGKRLLTLSRQQKSTIVVPENWTIPCPQGQEGGIPFILAVALQILAIIMLDDLVAGQTLLVIEPDAALADILVRHASERGVRVVLLTSHADVLGDLWVKIHPTRSKREIQALLPDGVSALCNASGNDALGARIAECLPSSCKITSRSNVIGKEPRHDQDENNASIPFLIKTVWFQSQLDHTPWAALPFSLISLGQISDEALTSFEGPQVVVDWQSVSEVSVHLQPVLSRVFFPEDKTYWLVGLTGGLGQSLCQWMIQRGARNIMLTSRNPKVEERWLEEMKALGAVVTVLACDVTDKTSIKSVYHMISHNYPPLAGVAQGAMVLADTMFVDYDMERASKVLGPKVDGSRYLDELLVDVPLDFFVFFSSMAAVTGNSGQSMYAAANMFMSGLAANRRKRGLAASVINIGAIVGNGYVTREVSHAQQVALRNYGNTWMSELDFRQIFAEAVLASPADSDASAELMTGLRLVDANGDDRTTWFNNPKFQNHVVEQSRSTKAETSGAAAPVKVQLLSAVTMDEALALLKAAFITKLQAMLQLTVDEDGATNILAKGADELGIDSLVAVEVRSWFLKELNVDLPVLKILGGIAMGDLVALAQEKLPESYIPNIGKALSEVPQKAEAKAIIKPIASKAPVAQAPTLKKIAWAKEPEKTAVHLQSPLKDSSRDVPAKNQHNNNQASVKNKNMDSQSTTAVSSTLKPLGPSNTDLDFPTTPSSDPSPAYIGRKIQEPERFEPSGNWSSRESTVSSGIESNHGNDPLASSFSSIAPEDQIGLSAKHSSRFMRTAPMSFGHNRFWFLRQFLEDQTTFNITCSIKLNGKLDVDALKRAVTAIGKRHEALRTCFFEDSSGQPTQGILNEPTLHLTYKSVAGESEISTEHDLAKRHLFNIENGEIMRILLLSLSETRHQIIVAYHHINMDGVSLEIILKELEQAYNNLPLAPVTLQYPDFSEQQREQHRMGTWNKELQFWREQLHDLPPPISLLTLTRKSHRVALKTYDFSAAHVTVGRELAVKIQAVCQRIKVSAFHFYLAAYKALLFRFLDSKDLCIGIADANRNEGGNAQAVGFFLNLLPLRFKAQEKQSFAEALREAKSKAHSALANSSIPFDVVINQLGVPRSAGHNPVFQAFINYRGGVRGNRHFCGCDTEGLEFESSRTAYDLSLDVVDYADGDVGVSLMAQKELYSVSEAEILTSSYVHLLKTFAENSAVRLSRVALFPLTDVERAMELGRGPVSRSQWPETMAHQFAMISRENGDRVAVKDGLGTCISYSQLERRADSIVSALLAKGLDQGSTIGVFQEPSADWIGSLLAIWKIGAVYVPLDPRSTISRLATIANDCGLDALLIHSLTSQDVFKLNSQGIIINVSSLQEASHSSVSIRARAEMPAVYAYTSGSTGTPKGIVLHHAGIVNNTESASKRFHFNKDTVLQQSSLSFDMSLSQICIALATGGSLYILSQALRGDSAAIARVIADENISFTQGTPSEYSSWLRQGDISKLRQSQWRIACSGGEQLTLATKAEFRALGKSDLRLFSGYGPTEITFTSSSVEVLYNNPALDAEQVPAGFTWPNYSVYIFDDSGKPLPIGVPGEIIIGGIGVASQYLNNSETTANRFISDVYAPLKARSVGFSSLHRTGDRGRLREDGALMIEGRIDGDTQVKLRGLRIDLQEIESVLLATSGGVLAEAVISLRGDDADSKYLVAHAMFAASHSVAHPTTYLKKLAASLPLPQYMRPSIIVPMDDLPKNSSSKLDRLAIAKLPLPLQGERLSESTEQLSGTERRLMSIWERVVPRDILKSVNVDASTDFFSVGGSSLLLLQLRKLVQSEFDVDIPLVELFEASTLRGMAAKLGGSEPHAQIATTRVIDWEQETQLPPDLTDLNIPERCRSAHWSPRVVVLTGATGFLGRAVLQQLLEDESIEKVHCIAVRHNANRLARFRSPKLAVHVGDLAQPRLGLSARTAAAVFRECDAVVHNGADISFLKTYASLKRQNVAPTLELLRLALPHGAAFHYVSSASVGHLSEQPVFAEATAAAFPPPADGSDGYTATKWVNERLLEAVAERFPGARVVVHRPSSITGPDAPPLDVMSNLLAYSRQLRAVPVSGAWRGVFDFIDVNLVARDVVAMVVAGTSSSASSVANEDDNSSSSSPVTYAHHSGELQIPVDEMRAFLERESDGAKFEALPLGEWAARAARAGLDEMVAAFLGGVDAAQQQQPQQKPMTFPRLERARALVLPPPVVRSADGTDSGYASIAEVIEDDDDGRRELPLRKGEMPMMSKRGGGKAATGSLGSLLVQRLKDSGHTALMYGVLLHLVLGWLVWRNFS